MQKHFAALAVAALLTFAAPVAAHADNGYTPDPPVDAPGSSTVLSPPTDSAPAALPSTGMSDAVIPIGIAGGVLVLGGVGVLVSRRLARR